MTDKMWLVTYGEYEGYYIICAASNEADAQGMAEITGGSVEEVVVATPADMVAATVLTLGCYVSRTGDVNGSYERAVLDWRWASEKAYGPEVDILERSRIERKVDPTLGFNRRLGTDLQVSGTDHDGVRRAFAERRAALIEEANLRPESTVTW